MSSSLESCDRAYLPPYGPKGPGLSKIVVLGLKTPLHCCCVSILRSELFKVLNLGLSLLLLLL